MRTLILSLAAAGLLAACAPTAGSDPVAPPPEDGPATCKADQYQRLVGTNRAQLPQQPAGETWRVTCTTCPVTMDYNPQRLNIVYDEATGVIRQVKCG
ncbi:I78 family peptidase inhibitor [Brevundimonas sp. GCM10030266]|uniref:I78 family peptidase inhibitor n=1 Tax=Brevundimonas sp. GCM10030266 TaxID=3273386 RepID=UPI00360DCD16